MSKMRSASIRKGVVYLAGVFLLGVGQGWLRSTFGDAVSFALVIAFLILLRLVAEWYGNKERDDA